MRNRKFVLLLTGVFAYISAFSQTDSHLQLSEQYPKAGEKINLTYDPTGTTIEGKKDIKASIFYLDFKNYTAANTDLKAEGKLFKGELVVSATAKALLINIKLNGQVDNNSEKGYLYMIYRDNQPVEGAYASEAYFVSSGMGTHFAKIRTDINEGVDLYKKEFALYPQGNSEYQKAYLALWPQLTNARLKATQNEMYVDTKPGEHYRSLDQLRADLAKKMINQPAPMFILKDLNGKKVLLTDLKGKVVILDFWATWCGPCKASLPGMQIAVNKYKHNPNVKFLFIDTWEHGDYFSDDVKKFIADNKYTFRVLLDEKNPDGKQAKVVSDYNVSGIPTKFIIDKNGNIRFKYTGYSGTPAKLVDELTEMINMTKNSEPVVSATGTSSNKSK